MNQLIVSGNLTNDPTFKKSSRGESFCQVNVAVNNWEKRGEEFTKETFYLEFTVFGDRADRFIAECRKGSKVWIAGRLACRKWETKEGEIKEKWGIRAQTIEWARPKQPKPAQMSDSDEIPVHHRSPDEVPF